MGGDLPELIGAEAAQETIAYTDGIYLEFGADQRIEGIDNSEAVKQIRKNAIRAGLKLVDCPIRHLGTEMAQKIYGKTSLIFNLLHINTAEEKVTEEEIKSMIPY